MTALTGLVLCGGQSSRMQADKAFLDYYGKPQYAYVYGLLKAVCQQVFVSCNQTQQDRLDRMFPSIVDDVIYADAGPIGGLLSAFDHCGATALLVLACDYPFIDAGDVAQLLAARSENSDAVCFYHPHSGFEEPLLAIYEQPCKQLLHAFYKAGQRSPRHFLQTIRTQRVAPASLSHLQSIDTPEAYAHAAKEIRLG